MNEFVMVNDGGQPTDDLSAMLAKLETQQFNGKAGNKALREALNWDTERYWAAHGRALDTGKIVPGKGKGGSVRLSTLESTAESAVVDDVLSPEVIDSPSVAKREADLYEPARKVIEGSWAKAENFDDHIAATTAARGAAKTGGKWTRPDVSLLAVKAFPYLPTRTFEIATFEIKPDGQTTVEAVFEALSHQQFATRSYALYIINDADLAENFSEKHPDAGRILHTARQHGVGVIIASNVEDWDTWEELVAAARVSPDPEQANRFIATCFPEDVREQVIKWHK
jgi:hypothetical protein